MFENYEVNGLFDEMFAAPGQARAHYLPVTSRLQSMGADAIQSRRRMADVSFRNQGITFTVYSDS
ncbi:MAG: circularly permuted type 2 ATP-grasp protein, partial [Tepidisphaeraceae bacterium]